MLAMPPVALGTVIPSLEVNGGSAGSANTAAESDHAHPRVTSVTTHVSDANGDATITFTRIFPPFVNGSLPTWPGTDLSYLEAADNPPIVWKLKSWITDGGGNYTGCVVKLYRSQVLPTQTQLSLATLLTGLINGVNAIAASLTGLNIFGGSAANVPFSFIAIMRSG